MMITVMIIVLFRSVWAYRSGNGMTQDAYTFQIILDKDQVGTAPTVQELLDASFVSCDLQLEEVGNRGYSQSPDQ